MKMGGDPLVVEKDEFSICGRAIKEERQRLGYVRETIAERANISPRYLAAIELWEKTPKADVLIRIIKSMGISANRIVYPSQPENDVEYARLAHLIMNCTPLEQKLIAAIIDTIIDNRKIDSQK